MPAAAGGAIFSLGSSLIGGVAQDRAAGRQADAIAEGNQAAIDEQRAAREAFFERTQPFVDFGLGAGQQLMDLLNNPEAGLDQINPIVDILRNQGFEQIQESAASQGRLGAGGTLKDLTQFNTDLTTTVIPQLQNQRFNQLFNVLGLGANTATGQGNAALNTSSNISNFLSNTGQARGNQAVNQANAFTNTLSAGAQFFGGL